MVFYIFMSKTRCAGTRKDQNDGVQVTLCRWKPNFWKDQLDGDQVQTKCRENFFFQPGESKDVVPLFLFLAGV
jgi:hypothetical protein